MKNKKCFKLMSILIISFVLIVSAGFIGSAVDYGSLYYAFSKGQIFGEGMEIKPLTDGTQFIFSDEGAEFNIDGNSYKNIVPGPSFMELDIAGDLVGANFKVNDEGGKYCFGTNCFYAPPNSLVLFDRETGIINLQPLEGSEIIKNPWIKSNGKDLTLNQIQIIGKNLKLPNGFSFSGELNYLNELYFIDPFTSIKINNVDISTEDFRVIDFNCGTYELSYVSFCPEKIVMERGIGDINFKRGNPYIEVPEDGILSLASLSEIGKITLENFGGSNPVITAEGKFSLRNGKDVIFGDNFLSDESEKILDITFVKKDLPKNSAVKLILIPNNLDGSSSLRDGYVIQFATDSGFLIISPEDANLFPRITYEVKGNGLLALLEGLFGSLGTKAKIERQTP